jgi:hypothetical protein
VRILFTLQKRGTFWVVNCPSDKSIYESIHSTFYEAIKQVFKTYQGIERIDIVIPLPVPNPMNFTTSTQKNWGKKKQPFAKLWYAYIIRRIHHTS